MILRTLRSNPITHEEMDSSLLSNALIMQEELADHVGLISKAVCRAMRLKKEGSDVCDINSNGTNVWDSIDAGTVGYSYGDYGVFPLGTSGTYEAKVAKAFLFYPEAHAYVNVSDLIDVSSLVEEAYILEGEAVVGTGELMFLSGRKTNIDGDTRNPNGGQMWFLVIVAYLDNGDFEDKSISFNSEADDDI